MRLTAKIFAASLIPSLLLIQVAGWSLKALNDVADTNRTIVNRILPARRQAAEATELMAALTRHHARWIVLHDPAYATMWTTRADEFARRLDDLGSSLTSAPERYFLRKSRLGFARYRAAVSDGPDRALRPLSSEQLRTVRRMSGHVSRSLARLGAAIDRAALEAQQRADALQQRTWETVRSCSDESGRRARSVPSETAARYRAKPRRLFRRK